MKKYKYIGIPMLAAGLLAAASCSDFDDYNKVETDASASANQTLWENIKQNAQLSDFAALIQKSGFDQELSQTQYYTVWAPLNGTFDASAYQSLDQDALMRQFVKNHIASYGHRASGDLSERILMLNEKSYDFAGSGSSYSFDGVSLAEANLPSNNGMLHTLSGVASFYPNLYEFVTDPLLSAGKEIDSLRNYFLRYEETYLDTEASVVGPIVDGMQTYVDSVIVTENALWETLNIKMNNEDSTYTVIMPTNKAWQTTYDKIKSNYHYISTTSAQGFNGANILSAPNQITIDPAFWADSLTSRYMTRYLTFSNNNLYNRWLTGEASYLGSDTLYTTTRNKLSNPKDIIGQTGENLKMSNGVARIVDSLAILPWETYCRELQVSAASNDNVARVLQGSTNSVEVNVNNLDPTKIDVEEMESNTLRYLLVQNSGGTSKPELDIFLPGVLSTTYDIYCVFVPENVDRQKADAVTLPNRVIFTLNYCNEAGNLDNYTFLDENEERVAAFKAKYKLSDGRAGSTNYNINRAFSNDTSKVDTLYIGEFTFPVCYYGLGDGYCPNIKITSPFSAVTGNVRNDYTRDLRIAAIILKPKELVEFEESNKK